MVISKQPARHRAIIEQSNAEFVTWPPRSPDLSSLDHYYWARLKNKVFAHPRPRTLEALEGRILLEAELMNHRIPDELRRAIIKTRNWAEQCVNVDGDYLQ